MRSFSRVRARCPECDAVLTVRFGLIDEGLDENGARVMSVDIQDVKGCPHATAWRGPDGNGGQPVPLPEAA